MELEYLEFNTKIKSLREAHGYTQQQIADFLGIDKTTYAHYEAGRRLPNIDKIRRLAELYSLNDEMLNVLFPVEVIIKYPKSMLDKAEAYLKEAEAVQGKTIEQLNNSIDKLWKVFEPIFKIRQDAIKLPESADDYLKAGQRKTIKKVYLDLRGEKLITDYVKTQQKIYEAIKRMYMN